ncbi:Protein phosphatase 1E [Homalodisca vitripennis]|nr:Protein phosphatase 1E [Homalodisca vitripennis]
MPHPYWKSEDPVNSSCMLQEIAKPDVEEITLDGTEDFLIVGCDGLWDFVTEQEATNLVYNHLQENAGQC